MLALPRAILLPLNLTLVKFIPNFTPTGAITYTYIYCTRADNAITSSTVQLSKHGSSSGIVGLELQNIMCL